MQPGSKNSIKNKDDVSLFEKIMTWFALWITDVLLVNIKCCDIGCSEGTGFDLMLSILQAYKAISKDDLKEK